MEKRLIQLKINRAEESNRPTRAAESLWGTARYLLREEREEEAALVAQKAEEIAPEVGQKMRADQNLDGLDW